VLDGSATAQSRFTFAFVPTQDECWTLSYVLSGRAGLRVFADDGDDSILGVGTSENQTTVSGSITYLFRAGGNYGFAISASAGGNTLGSTLPHFSDASAWSFVFQRGGNCCTADFNQDHVVDFFDYLDFVNAFSAMDVSADFNNDGTIDFFDYLDFVDAFAQGC
jgi:hypothetical protein